MKNLSICENGLFGPALVISATIHGLLIGAGGWLSSLPYASVLNAPNSLEVTVIPQPVVSVIREEIVSEEMVERNGTEGIVFGARHQEFKEEAIASSAESRGAVTKAEPLTQGNPAPPYPRIARQRGWEGIVRLEVYVDQEGMPDRVMIKDSSGYGALDDAAMRTVKKWKFSPARSGGIRFSSRVTIPIRFTLVRER